MAPGPTQIMQGIEVPSSSVNPREFMRLTRRISFIEKNIANFAGLGFTDTIPILQTGVLSGLMLQFSGNLNVNIGTGTVASTGRWPYDLAKAIRFSANGQSNLINCHGAKLKAREMMQRGDLTDRGVVRGIGGASPGTQVNQGTLSLNSESWGVGSNVSAIPTNAAYPVELEWYIPVAFDEVTLTGAIFAQTSATDLNLAIDWAPLSDLFVLTGNAAVTLTGTLNLEGRLFSIPQGRDGNIIIPDLSIFHSIIESRIAPIANGDNENRFAGQGVGKQLLRWYAQVWNTTGTSPAPLPVNSTNFGNILWRFGANDTPELYNNGNAHDHMTERTFDSDLGVYNGFFGYDFVSENAFRDSVDEALATELRFLFNIPSAVTLTNPYVEYVQETATVGASA